MSFLKPEGIHFAGQKTSIVGATFGYAPEEVQQDLALLTAGLFLHGKLHNEFITV